MEIRRSDNGAEVPSNPSLKMFLMMRFNEFIYARIRRSENGAEVPVELLLLCIPPQVLHLPVLIQSKGCFANMQP
ncbi:hypothetical protein Bca52824_016897 [Brassica carinata]|uniref:Uncharacterized protein n=1 Tax=Brassica carinata TaxID=52824 RepID=A0A8X7VM02_BRACI|nr:hypothetical protein Bca52824_016897 [Brassica carinata]